MKLISLWDLNSFVPDLTKYQLLDEEDLTDEDMESYTNQVDYIRKMFNDTLDMEFSLTYYGNYSVTDIENMSISDFHYHYNRFVSTRSKEAEKRKEEMEQAQRSIRR